jgi:hypothetical protein
MQWLVFFARNMQWLVVIEVFKTTYFSLQVTNESKPTNVVQSLGPTLFLYGAHSLMSNGSFRRFN